MGLSQAEMCHGLIQQSFYSRIERNCGGVRIGTLLDLLNVNQISLYDFFKDFEVIDCKNVLTEHYSLQDIASDIGERLYQLRKILGLSKCKMAVGVIDASYYSRVERGQNQISDLDLIALLRKHQVSIVDFLVGLGDTKPKLENYREEIVTAFAKKDSVKLQKILHDMKLNNIFLKDKMDNISLIKY